MPWDVNNIKWLFSVAETLHGLQLFSVPLLPLPQSQLFSPSAVCLTGETCCFTLVSATLVAVLLLK